MPVAQVKQRSSNQSRKPPSQRETVGHQSAQKLWGGKALKQRQSLQRHLLNKVLSPLCNDSSPCNQLICPVCRFRAQKQCIGEMRNVLERPKGSKAPKRGKQCFITVIAKSGVFPEEPPTADEFIQAREAYHRVLRRHAPKASFLCCLDLSKNTDIQGEVSWVLHVHGLALNFGKQHRVRVSQALRKAGSPSKKPLVAKKANDPVSQLAYCAKAQFSQRQSYTDKKGRANTRNRPLSIEDEVQLALGLSRLKAPQRFFHIGRGHKKVDGT